MVNIRNVAYYGMTKEINKLYEKSKNNEKHNKIMKLITSKKNILLAIKTISENDGRNTPGSDKKTFDELLSEDNNQVISLVRNRLKHSRPGTIRKVKIPKGNGKGFRTLGIGTILDRVAQQCFLNILTPITEAKFSKNSFGFRPNVTTKHAFANIADALWKGKNNWEVIEIDFKNYFDSVNIDRVLDSLRNDFNICDTEFHRNIKRLIYGENGIGVPQGSVLGPILSNVYLHSLDVKLDKLKSRFERSKDVWTYIRRGTWDKKRGQDVFMKYSRYADDIRLIVPSENEAIEVLEVIREWCKENDIMLNEDRTKRYNTKERQSIEMVGFRGSRGQNGFIISPIDQKDVIKTLRKHRDKCKVNGNNPSGLVAAYVTLMSHYDICTNMQFLIKELERWLNPTKRGGFKLPVKLVKGKDNKRIYYLKAPNRDGEIILEPWVVREQTKRSISNYLRVPFIDNWDNETKRVDCVEYMQGMEKQNHNGKLTMYLPGLLHRQKFVCYVSGKPLTPGMIDIHHKNPLSKGGKDVFSNLVLLDRDIHKDIHSNNKDSYYYNNPKFQMLLKQTK